VSINELNLEQQLELKKILEAKAAEKQTTEKPSSMHTENKAEVVKKNETALAELPKGIQYLTSLPQKADNSKTIIWNLPRQDNIFIGREALLAELHQQLTPQPAMASKDGKEQQALNTLAISAFAGLSGIGKTQLALQYTHHTEHSYTLKAWFPAENLVTLKQSFIEFSKTLGYQDEKVSFETAFIYIKQWLTEHPGWLLIYDNVNSYEEITSFLPGRGGSLILTTRYNEWPDTFKKLDITLMSEDESVKLIQTLTKQNKETEETKQLVKLLGYLPLALAQASAYIVQKKKSIADYLTLYKKYEKELLADSTLSKGANHLPVATTWNITLEALAKEAKDKQQPLITLELLQVCAYLESDKIPRTLLLTWLKECHSETPNPELVIDDYISQLGQYSLIHFDGNTHIGIHRLVQTVLRQQHQSTKQSTLPALNSQWYESLLEATNSEFNREIHVLEDEIRKKILLPHLKSLLHYNYASQIITVSAHLSNLLHNIGFVLLYRLDNPKEAYLYLIQALNMNEQLFGRRHINIASSLHNLGNAFGSLGDHKQKKVLLEHALAIEEQHFGKEHPEVAITLQNLGNAFGSLGDHKQKKVLLERALAIKEQHFGKEHPSVALTLYNLAITYEKFNSIEIAYNLAERSYQIYLKTFGNQHVDTQDADKLQIKYKNLLPGSTVNVTTTSTSAPIVHQYTQQQSSQQPHTPSSSLQNPNVHLNFQDAKKGLL
jgi:hypothetical protein